MTQTLEYAQPPSAGATFLIERARMGLRIVIVSLAVFALTDVHLASGQLHRVYALKAALLATILCTFYFLRRTPTARRATAIMLSALGAVCATSAVSGMVTNDTTTTLILCTAIASGAAILLPWGAYAQLAAALLAGAAILVNVYLVRGNVDVLIGYPSVSTTLALGISVYFAYAFDRHRVILEQEDRDRARREEALHRSEADFRSIIDHIEDVFYRTDLAGTIQVISPSVERYGYRVDELIGQLTTFFHVEPEARLRNLQALLEQHVLQDVELSLRVKDGRTVPVSVNVHLLFDEQGRPIGLEGMLRDVTERKQAEEALHRLNAELEQRIGERTAELERRNAELRESEEHFRALVENAFDAVSLFGPEGNLLYTSPNSSRVFGRRIEDAVGHNLLEFTHPDDQERTLAGFAALLQTPGHILTGQFRQLHQNGSWLWLEITARNLLDKPSIGAIVANYRDITERKQAEERNRLFQALIDQSNDAIEVMDPQTGRFLDVNEKGCLDLGYSRDEFLRLSVFDIYPMVDRSLFEGNMREIRTSGDLMWEGIHRRKDGSTFPVEVNLKHVQLDRDYIVAVVRDITSRKEMDAVLREREQLLSESQRIAHIGSWSWDLIAAIRWTDETYRIHGVSPETFTPSIESLVNLLHPEDRSAMQRWIEACGGGQSPGALEFRVILPDGHARDLSVRGELIYATENSPACMTGTVQDVTERKRAEEQAQIYAYQQAVFAQLGRFALTGVALAEFLSEAAHQAALALDTQWCHVFERPPDGTTFVVRGAMNSPAAEPPLTVMQGGILERVMVAGEQLVVDDLDTEEGVILPPWLQGAGLRSAMLVLIQISTGPYGVLAAFSSIPCRFKFGDVHFLQGIANLVAAFVERTRTKERLLLQSSALEAAANAIVITDPGGVILSVNAAFTRLSGYASAEAVGRNPRAVLKSGQHDVAFYKNLWDTILAGRVWQGQMINRRKDHTLYTEHQTITPVRASDGHISHFISIKEDISERLELEAQFRQSQKLEAVGRLAGGIAHDFNNQLFVINGYCELVASAAAGQPALLGPLEQIRNAARRSAEMTAQLLSFSRKHVLQPKVLSLNDELLGVEKMLRRLIGEDVQLTIVPGEDVGHVKVDPGQLHQVIMNLAVNAKDAMPDGGQLTLGTVNTELDEAYAQSHIEVNPGRYVLLSASDSGHGMDRETRERVFEPFFTTKEVGKGTGLGLATVYGIVKQSGGHITVYSEPGRGTTFKIYFPRVDEPVETAPRGAAEKVAGGSETILLAEDEPAVMEMVRRVLEERGYRVLVAANGRDALAVARRFDGQIDLLLTDVVMPEMGGSQLAEGLLKSRPQTYVIYMSGYTDDAIVHHGVFAAEQAFLSKPCPTDTLLRKVREVLDARPPKNVPGGRILIVDDSENERILLAYMLSEAGYRVIEAASGEEALAVLERESVDAVITDVNMPRMGGFALIEAIRRSPQWQTLPVIILAGACMEQEQARSRAAGATAYLDKGTTGAQGLLDVLAQALSKS